MLVNNLFSNDSAFNTNVCLDVCTRSNRTEILIIKYKFWTYPISLILIHYNIL